MALIVSCSKENDKQPQDEYLIDLDTIHLEHSMKGWELYSWPNGVEWSFSLMAGTNVLKDYEQVINQPLIVNGVDSLKELLMKLPRGEEIAWMSENWLKKIWDSNYNNLMLPPENIVREVDAFCVEYDLILMIAY